jgi:hypothetical protein
LAAGKKFVILFKGGDILAFCTTANHEQFLQGNTVGT